VLCGLAPNIGVLIASRALQGCGAALLVPSSLAILNHAAEDNPALRARMVGLWTAAGGVSIAAGPIAGGLPLAAFRWRRIFLVNILLCGLAILLVFRYVPADSAANASRHLDPLGQLLAVVALTGLIGAIIEAGRRGPENLVVIGSAIIGLSATAIFLWVEK